MRRRGSTLFALLIVLGALVPLAGGSASATPHTYVVVYEAGATLSQARAAIAAAGGTLVQENAAVGVATVVSNRTDFLGRVRSQSALFGATRNRVIAATKEYSEPEWLQLEQITNDERRSASADGGAEASRSADEAADGAEPLANLQWDMQQIHATVDGSYAKQDGDERVLVGVIDTGIDGSHPDLAPNLDVALSRNFTTDIPDVDGPCEVASCVDPADVDDGGHGSHVAGIIAAAANGLGTAGVAPGITLVNIRAGQDSGFFFLQETVNALTYAGDVGIDVVNMSYFTDPWLYNCSDHPSDSAEEQEQQRTIVEATNRANDYAYKRNVTLVAAEGNEHTDLGAATKIDTTSPDYPLETAKEREVDNSCITVPTELPHVIAVSALGPSERKADYSNYGTEQTDVSAPGGWFRDGLGTPTHRTPGNTVLSSYPRHVAEAEDLLNPDGTSKDPFTIVDCNEDDVCGVYEYLQGTSMASPHAAGVVALIVSQYGVLDGKHHDGLTLNPLQAEKILYRTARDHACPDPRLVSYTDVGRDSSFDAYCDGGLDFNGFYGNGIVDALAAVTGGRGVGN
jgi:lantibiotic leader peptide-processing serine protease